MNDTINFYFLFFCKPHYTSKKEFWHFLDEIEKFILIEK